MPSTTHEVLVEMVLGRPRFTAELLAGVLQLDLPPFDDVRAAAAEATDLSPTEYRADAVVTLDREGRPVLAVVIEAQLRPKDGKRCSWPVYITTIRARLRCPAVLLVLCVDHATARWCAEPIAVGNPHSALHPLVVGPGDVPVVDDAARAAREPELAVLSAMAHGAEQPPVLDALLAACATVDRDRAALYLDIVLSALPAAAAHHLEALMPKLSTGEYEYQSDYARRYFGQGKAEGKAEAVLDVLRARGVDVPPAAPERILACTDPHELDGWVRRAVTATAVDELFAAD